MEIQEQQHEQQDASCVASDEVAQKLAEVTLDENEEKKEEQNDQKEETADEESEHDDENEGCSENDESDEDSDEVSEDEESEDDGSEEQDSATMPEVTKKIPDHSHCCGNNVQRYTSAQSCYSNDCGFLPREFRVNCYYRACAYSMTGTKN